MSSRSILVKLYIKIAIFISKWVLNCNVQVPQVPKFPFKWLSSRKKFRDKKKISLRFISVPFYIKMAIFISKMEY